MAGENIQHTMSASIDLDVAGAVKSFKTLTSAVKASTSEWKANESAARRAGDYQKAQGARVAGLTKSVQLQQAALADLKRRQAEVDTSTEKGTATYYKLGSEIANADKKLSNMTSQLDTAKGKLSYYTSGLSDLQKGYKESTRLSDSYISRLEAEGKQDEANAEKLKSYQSGVANLTKQLSIQQSELEKLASTTGKSSDAYKLQQERVNSTATDLAKAKTQMNELSESIAKANPSFFDKLKNKLTGVDSKAKDTKTSIADIAKGSAIGNIASNWISNLGSGLANAAKQGFQLNLAGEEVQKKWSNLGLATSKVKELTSQIGEIRGKSDASGASIVALQKSLYSLTGSVPITTKLTDELFGFGKAAGLSEDKISQFGSKLTKVFSASKVGLAVFNRTFSEMPGLKTAIQKASGMTKDAFNKALSDGKISGQKLESYMVKASADSSKAWDEFGKSSTGKIDKLKGSWTNMTAVFMKPIATGALAGINSVMKSITNKKGDLNATGKELQSIIQNLSKKVGSGIATTLKFIAQHSKGVAITTTAVLSLAAAFKVATGVIKLFDIVANANPFALMADAIILIGVAFVALYKKCKPFRNFINGIGKAIVKAFAGVPKTMRDVGNWFKKTFSGIRKFFSRTWNGMIKGTSDWGKSVGKWFSDFGSDLSKGWHSFWSGIGKFLSKAWNGMIKGTRDWGKSVGKWFSDFGSGISKAWHGFWSGIGKFLSKAWDGMIKGTSDWGKSVGKWFSDFGSSFSRGWHGFWNGIGKFLGNIWDGIVNSVKDSFNGIIKIINAVIGAINTVWRFFTKHNAIGYLRKLAAGGVINAEQRLVMVNDDGSADPRELIQLPNGKMGMFQGRNQKTVLPVGTRVYNSKETKNIFHNAGIEHYANGGWIGNVAKSAESFIGGAWSKAKAIGEWLAHPAKFVGDMINKVLSNMTASSSGMMDLAKGIFGKLTSSIVAWFKRKLTGLDDKLNITGKVSGHYNPALIRKAAAIDNVNPSDSFIRMLEAVIMSESGGRNIMQQIQDINTATGNPAGGILQYTKSTFGAYARSGYTNWLNPLDQLVAFFNNSDWQNSIGWTSIWGHNKVDWLHSGPQGSRRYAHGGWADQPSIFGESGLELAVPMNNTNRAITLLGQAVNVLRAKTGMTSDVDDIKNSSNEEEHLFRESVILLLQQILGQKDDKKDKEEHDFMKDLLLLLRQLVNKSSVADIKLTTPQGHALWEVVEPFSKAEQRAEMIKLRRGLSGR